MHTKTIEKLKEQLRKVRLSNTERKRMNDMEYTYIGNGNSIYEKLQARDQKRLEIEMKINEYESIDDLNVAFKLIKNIAKKEMIAHIGNDTYKMYLADKDDLEKYGIKYQMYVKSYNFYFGFSTPQELRKIFFKVGAVRDDTNISNNDITRFISYFH